MKSIFLRNVYKKIWIFIIKVIKYNKRQFLKQVGLAVTGLSTASCTAYKNATNWTLDATNNIRKYSIGYLFPANLSSVSITNTEMRSKFWQEHNSDWFTCVSNGVWGRFKDTAPKAVVHNDNFSDGRRSLSDCYKLVNGNGGVVDQVKAKISEMRSEILAGNVEYSKTADGTVDYNTVVVEKLGSRMLATKTSFLGHKATRGFEYVETGDRRKNSIFVKGNPEFLRQELSGLNDLADDIIKTNTIEDITN
jgi:hypothetical protein